MPGWNDSFTEVDFAAIAFLEMFAVAKWERDGTGSTPPTVAAGTDVQASSYWSSYQSWVQDMYESGTWMKPGYDPDGVSTSGVGFDFSVYTDWADYEDAFFHDIQEGFDAVGIDGWMRKRPREIELFDDQFDVAGNKAADGHRAVMISGPIDQVYVYDDGDEVWVLDTLTGGDGPDTLVGEAGVEQTIANLTTFENQYGRTLTDGAIARNLANGDVYSLVGGVWTAAPSSTPPRLPTGSGVIFGHVQSGDIIGPWIFEELRDMINALGDRTWSGTDAPTLFSKGAGSGSSTTAAAAFGAATSAYSTSASPGFGSDDSESVTMETDAGSSLAVLGSKCSSRTLTTARSHRSRTINFYATITRLGDSSGPSNTSLFDGQTLGYAEEIKKYATETVAAGVASSPAVHLPFNSSSPPPSYTSTNGYHVRGWRGDEHFAIVEWDFTYGAP